jgi:hypothetical protein
MTVDWVRWGNGVILDPRDPGATSTPALSITRAGNGLQISWTGSGIVQSADELRGPWTNEPGLTSGATITPSANQKFYRLQP